MSELKPCPFCDSSEVIPHETKHWTGQRNVVLSVTLQHWCKHEKGMNSFLQIKGQTTHEAVLRWNTRTDDKRIAELQAQVKDAFRAGYTQGHNDTVESCYCLDDELKADEYIQEQKP